MRLNSRVPDIADAVRGRHVGPQLCRPGPVLTVSVDRRQLLPKLRPFGLSPFACLTAEGPRTSPGRPTLRPTTGRLLDIRGRPQAGVLLGDGLVDGKASLGDYCGEL
ncbi:hypothetical protein KPB2_5544 [Klebsiella pneumoniae Kb677]|nr:hypothetical protein KPB2_5544 [Klebsiella pneumoniae Kb677]